MGTAISCTECSQVAGLIQKLVETPRKHRLFVQLSFVRRSCVVIVIVDRHVYVLSVRKRMRARARTHAFTTEVLEVPEVLMANKAQCMHVFALMDLGEQG